MSPAVLNACFISSFEWMSVWCPGKNVMVSNRSSTFNTPDMQKHCHQTKWCFQPVTLSNIIFLYCLSIIHPRRSGVFREDCEMQLAWKWMYELFKFGLFISLRYILLSRILKYCNYIFTNETNNLKCYSFLFCNNCCFIITIKDFIFFVKEFFAWNSKI